MKLIMESWRTFVTEDKKIDTGKRALPMAVTAFLPKGIMKTQQFGYRHTRNDENRVVFKKAVDGLRLGNVKGVVFAKIKMPPPAQYGGGPRMHADTPEIAENLMRDAITSSGYDILTSDSLMQMAKKRREEDDEAPMLGDIIDPKNKLASLKAIASSFDIPVIIAKFSMAKSKKPG